MIEERVNLSFQVLFIVVFVWNCKRYRVDKNEDGRITEEEVKEVIVCLELLLCLNYN